MIKDDDKTNKVQCFISQVADPVSVYYTFTKLKGVKVSALCSNHFVFIVSVSGELIGLGARLTK